jgi:predicted ATPase
MRKVGTLSGITRYIAFLAAAQVRAGDIVGALASVERSISESSYELADRPETRRLRGELQRAQGNKIAAESGFREAIELAKKLEAGTPEVRATTSLARLLRDTGRNDDARAMLAEIYGWFTEGFNTADLREAKTLLDELNDGNRKVAG